jgi:hypothetical protein
LSTATGPGPGMKEEGPHQQRTVARAAKYIALLTTRHQQQPSQHSKQTAATPTSIHQPPEQGLNNKTKLHSPLFGRPGKCSGCSAPTGGHPWLIADLSVVIGAGHRIDPLDRSPSATPHRQQPSR